MKTLSTCAEALMTAPAPAWAMSGPAHNHNGTQKSESGLIQMLRVVAVEILALDAAPDEQGEPLDLTQLVRESAHRFEVGQDSARHPVHFEGTGACWVRGDREHLRAMVLCLLLNAGGHSLPGRTISVSVWCHGDSAHLSVLDRGAGALPVENEISFQPFRRLEAAPQVAPYLDENGEWWLSLAARIAYAHGGDILLGGTPGLGSEVDVRLPLCRRDGS